MPDSISQFLAHMLELLVTFGVQILAAVAIFLAGRWVAKLSQRLVRRVMEKAKLDATLTSFISNLTFIAVLAIATIIALGQVGVQTASIVAVIGAAGIAIGLALQGSLSNFAAGLLIVIFRPLKVGDLIEGADILGFVEDIQILTTRVRTLDNKVAVIPNASLTDGTVVNYSAKPYVRLDLVIGVSYEADIDQTRHVILEALSQDPKILTDPAPQVGVLELADSSVNFAVRPFVRAEDYWKVKLSATELVKKHLDAANITIPFPQRDVHIIQ